MKKKSPLKNKLFFGLSLVAALYTNISVQALAASDHVLVMTISNYAESPLKGVKFDADNALKIATKLGYDTGQAMVFKDSQLTAKGLKDALGQLSEKVQQNDRVFVYYSGHGFSQRQGNQCVQTLVGQDGGMVSLEELNKQLDNIKTRTSNVFVLIDSCHSGGLRDMVVNREVTASARSSKSLGGEVGLTSKAFEAKSGEVCHDFVNYAKSWSPVAARDMSSKATMPQNNFTFIAAANEREQALDDSQRGGLATVNLLSCLDNGVKDLDGNGSISASELIACAQEKVNVDVPRINKKFLPHTIEAYGNKAKSLSTVKVIAVAQNNAQVNQSVAVISSSNTPNSANPQKITYSNDAMRTLIAFQDFASGSNGNWATSIEMPDSVKMGTDAAVYYSSVQPGFVTILYVGSDGKEIKAIAENAPIEATQKKFLGNIPIFDCKDVSCPGANTFLAIFSQGELDINNMLNRAKAGDKILVSPQLLANISCATDASLNRNAGSMKLATGCNSALSRNAGSMKLAKGANIDGYAARIAVVNGY